MKLKMELRQWRKFKKWWIEKICFIKVKKIHTIFGNWTIKSFARNSFSGKIVLDDADQDKVELVIQIMDFKNNTKPKNKEKNQKILLKKVYAIFEGYARLLSSHS